MNNPLNRGFIAMEDPNLVTVTDGVGEAVELILDYQRRVRLPEARAENVV